jgi:hypothetical protein
MLRIGIGYEHGKHFKIQRAMNIGPRERTREEAENYHFHFNGFSRLHKQTNAHKRNSDSHLLCSAVKKAI